MDREDALGMAARLWCLPRHSHKEMDSELAEDIASLLLSLEICEGTYAGAPQQIGETVVDGRIQPIYSRRGN